MAVEFGTACAEGDYKNVHTDVRELLELGLLEKDARGRLTAPFGMRHNPVGCVGASDAPGWHGIRCVRLRLDAPYENRRGQT